MLCYVKNIRAQKGFSMRIYGKARDVFSAIKNICRKNPHMTLTEAFQKGLLSPSLQNTEPLEIGKYPYVYLSNDYLNN